MGTRRIRWIFVTSLIVACLSWGIAPSTASGQSYAEMVRMNDCISNMNARSDALSHQQWALLVSLGRQFIGHCLDLYGDNKVEATALDGIGVGLYQQGKFDEAIPLLERCVTVKPDAAYCYVDLGAALEGLGRLVDARKTFERAISIGGYDQVNASAIGFAQRELAAISKAEESRKSETLGGSEPPPPTDTKKFGTGFVVSNQGHILTNNHVVAGCKTLSTRDGKSLQLLSRNASSDLALLQADFKPSDVAVFRTGPAPKLGDSVVAFGFPLPGLLSSDGNVSAGILSATAGLQNDVRFIQISAPVQPGNSGGPLFDSSGHVIGVVVAKLDAVRVAQITGDVPQNVNFAVHWAEVRAFLDDAGVPYRKEISQHAINTRSTAAIATKTSVAIQCTL
jgi:S1-C subfamily serine protease